MAVAQRRGRGWDLPGLSASAPGYGGRGESQIRVFSSKGLAAPGVLGTAPLPQIGVPIPGTNLVYVRPRLAQDEGIGGGGGGSQFPYQRYRWPGEEGFGTVTRAPMMASAVHVTNPEYANYRRYRRTASIGMGGALSTGLNMDLPFQSDAPGWFSIP